MADVGVPIVPGTPGPVEDADEALGFAREIGFPVIIKAAAGGGGKGMRVANDADDFARAFQLARSEALSAFGNGDVYVEKYLARPRHIEFQIMGDSHGNVIHLGERDCSVQRRHQKLIEEAPSPAMTPELRQRMGDDAVRGAKAIDYVGAGTIEMLLDEDGSYYFMEMNTRIQVEHPVTEMLTGVDLVKEQIRVAAGEPLSVPEMPPLRGHVIEVRVNAEDPARNFQPSPGRIDVFNPPGGPGVRVDTHIYTGYTVPPYYDSLLAKLICQGSTRAEAIKRMQIALDFFIVEGVTTTVPFLGARDAESPLSGGTSGHQVSGARERSAAGAVMRIDVVFGPPTVTPALITGPRRRRHRRAARLDEHRGRARQRRAQRRAARERG